MCCVKMLPTRAVWFASHGTTADEDALGAWENEFAQIAERFPDLSKGIEMSMRAEPLDAAMRERVELGRKFILAHSECGSCWKWDGVLKSLKDLDGSVRLARLTDKKFIALYFFYTNTLFLNADDLLKATTEEIAASLVHEITHRLVWRAVANHASFTRDEMLLLLIACNDFWQRDKIADEGIAYWNQVTWTESAGLKTHGKVLPGTLAWIHGDTGSGTQKLFAAEVLTPPNTSKLRCGPPVIIRGANRGTYFDPIGLAPDILNPLFAEVFGGM